MPVRSDVTILFETLVTYSHALPIAYEIEQKQAIYPRIVIDKNIIAMMRPGEKLELDMREIQDEQLICRENGIFFLNIVGDSPDECHSLAKDIYEAEKLFLEGNEHELSKHRWLQNLIISLAKSPLEPYMGGVEIFNPLEYI